MKAIAALLLLNSVLSFENWWPTPGIKPDLRLAPEFVGLWIVLLILVKATGALSRKTVAVLALAYLALVVGRYADVTVPALFGRSINLYWDGYQVPIVLSVLARKVPWWVPVALVGGLALLVWGLYRTLRWAIQTSSQTAIPAALRSPSALAVTASAMVLVAANLAGVQATWPWVSKPVIPTYVRQANLLASALLPGRALVVLPASPAFDSALTALAGADLSVFFLESYGATAFDNPQSRQALASPRESFAKGVAAAGQQVLSAYVRSPTFGGGSELAHLGFLSGIELSDPFRHDLLLTTKRATLVSFFRSHGYQTFGLYPALSWDWPEKSFYGFDVFVDGRDLTYLGPQFGSWKIPDQFALARFEQMHTINANTPPRFLLFPTIISHIPFAPVPPYQPDWSKLLSSEPFTPAAANKALESQPNWLNLSPDYRRSIAYTFEWLAGYVRQPKQRETVIVLLGDHQPASSVSGANAPWDVPVHIVTASPRLVKRLQAAGFKPGLEPQRPTLGEMHELTQLLLNVFDGSYCLGGDGVCGQKP